MSDPIEEDIDVIVIGGGIAGMVAANRAGQLGKRAIVLEKGREELYPCNTRWSGGGIHVHYTDPKAPIEQLRAVIDRSTEGFTKPELRDALAEDSGRVVQWLRDEGVRMLNLGGHRTSVFAPPASTGPGLDWKGRGGDMALRRLEANLNKRGGAVLRGTEATAIEATETGMRIDAVSVNGDVAYRARDVVIADGGFPANLDLIRQHISPHPEKILQRNAGQGTGDGMRMAQALGAAVTEGLDCFYGHVLSRDALTNNKLWPWPYLDPVVTAGIAVDGAGRRFADEGNGGVYVANAIARLPDPLSAWVVFDHPIWTGPGTRHLVAPNPHLQNAGGTMHRAGTLDELAKLMNVPAETLIGTIADYNAALSGTGSNPLMPSRRTDHYTPMPIVTAPFYGVPAVAGITYIMGGIAINKNCQVLHESGEVIPHLYAAGTCTGGLEGGPAIGYLGGLCKSGVLGLRAGEHIAGR
jgi:fumarate reductase flavoprotein subunit